MRVRTYPSTAAADRPSHSTERRARASALSRPKRPPYSLRGHGGVELLQHSVAQRTGRGNAHAVAAGASTVEEPVPQEKGAMRTGRRHRPGRVVEQRGRQRSENGAEG